MTTTPVQKHKVSTTPKLRFKGFGGIWTEKKLGELFVERTERKGNKEYNLLSVTLKGGIKSQKLSNKKDSSSEDKSNYKVVRVNDIAYNTMRMWQGASGVSNVEGIVSPAYTVVTLRNGNVDFFKHLFKQSRTIFNFYRYSQGMTSDTWNLKFHNFSEVSVIVPETEKEQAEIASFLDAVDIWLDKLRKEKELLQQYKKGLVQEIFSQEIRFKDDNGKDFPKWEKKKLSSFLIERNEKAPKSDQYPLMAFVAHKGVTPKGERYNREFLVNDSDNKNYKRTEYGDFIYSSNNLETGSIGLNHYGSASISPVYSIFQIGESCDYEFISICFTRKSFINKMIRYRQGVVYGQWKIHESDFLMIEENIPSIKEQQKIADLLTSVDNLIESKDQQITQAEQWKKGLIQNMFV